jgi:hypothetical protein
MPETKVKKFKLFLKEKKRPRFSRGNKSTRHERYS